MSIAPPSSRMSKGLTDMIAGVWRIKWWKYRYALFAALLFNILLVNQFFEGGIRLSPFGSRPTTSQFGEYPAAAVNNDKVGPPVDSPEFESSALPAGIPSSLSEAPLSLSATSSIFSVEPSASSLLSVPSASSTPLTPLSQSVSLFSLNDYDFSGQYVGWPLKRLCNETEWVPGLTFVCDNNSGGIGNIRNFILTCIRYAIDGGASQLILPRIQRRSENDLANIFTAGFQPFDYFFDEQHFRYAINTFCPQMTIYNATESIPFAANITKVQEFYPKDLNIDLDGCDGRGVNRHLDHFRPKFHAWLKSKHWPAVNKPVTIRFKWATFFEWPIYRDGPEVAATFGDILRIRKDIQDLAASALSKMSTFVGIKPQPHKFEASYLGVHLRTESDALGFWPTFEEQSDGYLQQAKERGLKYAYLACGDPNEAKRFAEKALNRTQVQVATKLDLLVGDDRLRLDALSWDQQALVDFLMLEKSTHFTGCSFSSFTMNIAFKRHLLIDGVTTRQWRSPGDEYSTLIGRFESWYEDWMFMYECMWP